MAKQPNLEELKEELQKWQETKEFLNREIDIAERSTKNISAWMAENTENMFRAHHALRNALRNKDSEALEKTLDEMGNLAGTVLKIPLPGGTSIGEAAVKIFGNGGAEDVRILSELQAIELEFPQEIYAKPESPEENKPEDNQNDEADAKTDTAKAEEIAEKAGKATEKLAEAVNEAEEKKSSWSIWPFSGGGTKEKPADVLAQIQELRGELLGLRTSKPFYVNSFFDWMESMHLPPEGRPDVVGEGDYIDYLNRTYRNPEYLLRQVYNDCNETLQVLFDEICTNAKDYDALRYVFDRRDLEDLGPVVAKIKDNREVVETLLKENNAVSLADLALQKFPDADSRTEALRQVLKSAPEHLMLREDNYDGLPITDPYCVFNSIFDRVLKKDAALNPEAMVYTAKAFHAQGHNIPGTSLAFSPVVTVEEAQKLAAETQKQQDQQDQQDMTPLQIAAQKGHIEIVRALLAESRRQEIADGEIPPVSKMTQTLAATEDDPEKAKSVLHALYTVAGADTAAIDFYIDMRTAVKEEKTQRIVNLLGSADREMLESWLLLRETCEPGAHDLMSVLMLVPKTDQGRGSMFQAAVGAGVPPVAQKQEKDRNVQVARNMIYLHRLLDKALPDSGKSNAATADLDIFTATAKFIAANSSHKEYAHIVSARKQGADGDSLLEKIVAHDYSNPADRDLYLAPVLEAFAKDAQTAAALYAAAQNASHSSNAKKLYALADKAAGPYIQSAANDTASVLMPEKLGHIYHAYDAVGYFAGAKSGQSEAAVGKEDAQSYIDVLERRDGCIRIGDDLLRPDNWDMMIYNSQYGDLEVFKNGNDKIALALDESRLAEVMAESTKQKPSFVAFQDIMLLDAEKFTTLRYDAAAREIVFDQEILVADVKKEEFEALKNEIVSKNKDVFYLKEENLLVNTRKIDGVYTRTLSYYDPDPVAGDKEWEELSVELLAGGRSIFTRDLFGEREYGVETDITAQEEKDAALSKYITAAFAGRDDFEQVADNLAVNKNTVLAVRSDAASPDMLTVIGPQKYILEYLPETADDTPQHKNKSGLAQAFNQESTQRKAAATGKPANLSWVNAARILEAPFIEIDDTAGGALQVVVNGEEINLPGTAQYTKQLAKTHTALFEDFLCNKNDICEVSLHRGSDPRLVLKTGTEDVSIDINTSDIPALIKKLGLKDTVLGGKNGQDGSDRKGTAVLDFYLRTQKPDIADHLKKLKNFAALQKKSPSGNDNDSAPVKKKRRPKTP